jgi:hypothetical protein
LVARADDSAFDPALDLALSEADRSNFGGGSVTVSLPGGAPSLRILVRNEGSGVGEVGFDGARVSFSGEPIGTVRPAGGAAAAALHIDLGQRATPAAVEALLESFLLEGPAGADPASWRAVFTVADAQGRSAQGLFAPCEPARRAGPCAPAPPPPARDRSERQGCDFLLADAESDAFVFAPGRES